MRLVLYVCIFSLFVFLVETNQHEHGADLEDNEFAEFEDFDEGSDKPTQEEATKESALADEEFDEEDTTLDDEEEDAIVETEEDEFESLDPEEFEGLPGDDTIWENGNQKIKSKKSKKTSEPKLEIAKVPLHSLSWDKYYLEILATAGLVVYLVNFFLGKSKNNKIAGTWMRENLDFLSNQFELVGDDPLNKTPSSTNQLSKLSEHNYTLWCSGRQCCEGMLVEIKLLKRQDLVSVISSKMKPVNDQLTITVTLSDMDNFVFCVGTKKAIANLHKTLQDVNYFCTEKSRSGEKYGLSPSFVILSELYGDLANAMLNDKVVKVLNDSEGIFETLQITDQYCGPIPTDQDEPVTKQPATEKLIILTMNLPKSRRDTRSNEQVSSLLKLVVFLIDRIRKYRLARESKLKADKHRQEVAAKFLKLTHAQRQEAAQLKKEEKERALKEKMMNEEDPDKQRRMDEMIHRRELNKKNKKMMKSRQFKVKAM